MTKPRTQSPTVRREHESKIEYLGGSVGDRVKVASLPVGMMGFLGHAQRRAAPNGHRKRPMRSHKVRARVKRTRPVRRRKAKSSKRRR